MIHLENVVTEYVSGIKLLTESNIQISEGLRYHIVNSLPLVNNIYRTYSKNYFNLINEVRDLYQKGLVELCSSDLEIINLEIGKSALNEIGTEVYLDIPFLEEQDVIVNEEKHPALNKPKRGGSKKFYVYVRKPDGGIKKVSFGDTTGLSVKINDPKARKAFADRHKCSQKKDKTTAGYWSCRLPRYAKLLGLKSNFTGYW